MLERFEFLLWKPVTFCSVRSEPNLIFRNELNHENAFLCPEEFRSELNLYLRSLNMFASWKRLREVFWKGEKKGMELTEERGRKEGSEEKNKNQRTFVSSRLVS